MIIKCSEPKTELLDGGARLSCKLESEHLPPELYARVRGPVPLDTWQANWAAVALLYPAMALGADLHIKAPVSGRLLHALKSDVQALLVSYEPSLRRVEIVADVEQDVLLPPTGVATGFSAGVDSLATIALYEACPLPFRLSHLVVFNDGIFEGLFEPYRARCESYAAANGFGHFSVETNFGEVFNASPSDVGSFIRTHSLRNASTALLLEHAIGTYLYSSGIPYSEIRGGPASDMAHIDPILLPLLSSDRLRFVSAGAGMSRTEKTELISERQDAKKMLDVCVADPELRLALNKPNCSRCIKCIRTMVTLEALGKLSSFERVFDLDLFYRERTRLVRQLVDAAILGNFSSREAVDFARRNRVALPASTPLLRSTAALKASIRRLLGSSLT